MKGIVYSDFGHPEEVLKLMEVEKSIPQFNQALKVKATSLSFADYLGFIDLPYLRFSRLFTSHFSLLCSTYL